MDRYYGVPMLACAPYEGQYITPDSTRGRGVFGGDGIFHGVGEYGAFSGPNYAYDGMRGAGAMGGITVNVDIPYWLIAGGIGAAAYLAWKKGWLKRWVK